MRKFLSYRIFFIIPVVMLSCNQNQVAKTAPPEITPDVVENSPAEYPNVPDPDDYYKNKTGLRLIDTLESRFATDFASYEKQVRASHAKLFVCYITSELGNSLTKCERKEKPFIKDVCNKMNVPFIDFTDDLKNQPGITFMPLDGHFNQKGAIILANQMAKTLDANEDYRSNISFPASARPALLGDEEPGTDKIVEDKKGLPYKLITNAQGLRMSTLVEFPKKKQHVLLMGDSQIYFAGVDNPETITGLLQKRYQDKTIINSSKWAYTIDDELSQWNEKTKYTEPDIVLLELNGRNITNLFFSQKIKFHRQGDNKKFTPSPLEKEFYDLMFRRN